MKKLFDNLYFQFGVVNLIFWLTLALDWVGILVWGAWFGCWCKVMYDKWLEDARQGK